MPPMTKRRRPWNSASGMGLEQVADLEEVPLDLAEEVRELLRGRARPSLTLCITERSVARAGDAKASTGGRR